MVAIVRLIALLLLSSTSLANFQGSYTALGSKLETLLVEDIVALLHDACETVEHRTAPAIVNITVNVPRVGQSMPRLFFRSLELPIDCGKLVPSETHASAKGNQPFSSRAMCFVCLAWFAFWLALHCVCHFAPCFVVFLGATAYLRWERVRPLGALRAKWRQLARAQIYNVSAVLVGVFLSLEYTSRESLDTHFTWKHQVAFAAGIGHWTTSFLEDWCAPRMLKSAFLMHHFLAVCAFGACLWTHRMSAIGVGGFIFELPVICDNVLAALRWRGSLDALSADHLEMLWDLTLHAVLVGRALPMLIYIHSLIFWQDLWHRVPCQWIWHCFFLAFMMFTLGWYCMLLAIRSVDLAPGRSANQIPSAETVAVTEGSGDAASSEVGSLLGNEAPAQATASTAAESISNVASAKADGAKGVSRDEFISHCTSESCWVMIRGLVYDVTDFLEEHPGGSWRLLDYAGKDATAAFESAHHSGVAQHRLESMLVARLADAEPAAAAPPAAKAPASANEKDARATRGAKSAQQFSNAGGKLYSPLYPPSSGPSYAEWLTRSACAVGGILCCRVIPRTCTITSSLIGIVVASSFAFVARTVFVGRLREVRSCCKINAHVSAVAFVILCVVLQVVTPRVLLLGAACTLLLETVCDRSSHAMLRAPMQWALLACYLAPPSDGQPVWLAICASCALAAAARLFCRCSADCTLVFFLAGGWSTLLLVAFQIATVGRSAWPQGLNDMFADSGSIISIVGASVAVPVCASALLWTIDGLVGRTSSCFATIWFAYLVGVPLVFCELDSVPGIVGAFGWWLQIRNRARRLEARVRAPQEGDAPHLSPLLFMLDAVRGQFGMFLWTFATRAWQSLVNWILPNGLRVYAFESLLSDLDGRLKVGICLMLEGQQVEPGYVVCNVGHIPHSDWHDTRETVCSSLDIMEELHADAPGFVSNVLCVVPDLGEHRYRSPFDMRWESLRQINLSVWANQDAAMAWYRKSAAHAAILEKHRNGGLHKFGDMLMSLQASNVRWERRCQSCRKPVDGLRSDWCPHCRSLGIQGKTFPIPVF